MYFNKKDLKLIKECLDLYMYTYEFIIFDENINIDDDYRKKLNNNYLYANYILNKIKNKKIFKESNKLL